MLIETNNNYLIPLQNQNAQMESTTSSRDLALYNNSNRFYQTFKNSLNTYNLGPPNEMIKYLLKQESQNS